MKAAKVYGFVVLFFLFSAVCTAQTVSIKDILQRNFAKVENGGALSTFCQRPGTAFQYTGTLTDTSYAVVQAAVASNYIYVTVNHVVNNSASVGTKVYFYEWDGAAAYTLLPGGGSAASGGGGWTSGNGCGIVFKVPTAGRALVVKAITTGADVDVSITGFYTTGSY